MEYKGEIGKPFDWLYVDFHTLQAVAEKVGLDTELLKEDDSFAYLARLKKQS
jgi:hypothetical protein